MSTAVSQVGKSAVEAIANAVLYEGYILYPYRPSSVKNQQRWNFGVLSPPFYEKENEKSSMQTECLCEVDSNSTLKVTVRFLHLMLREGAAIVPDCNANLLECGHVSDSQGRHFLSQSSVEVNGRLLQSWQEAVERRVESGTVETGMGIRSFGFDFSFQRSWVCETWNDQVAVVKTQHALEGEVEIKVTPIEINSVSPDENEKQVVRISVVVRNTTQLDANVSRDEALLRSCVSTHTILETENGGLISSLDPPDRLRSAISDCHNVGTFPVLVGEGGTRDCILSSPIILYDYPQIAPQSAGDLFDGTEIDEILTLRIMSLTDDEKREIRSSDEMARQLLERTESVTQEELMKLHGVMRRES